MGCVYKSKNKIITFNKNSFNEMKQTKKRAYAKPESKIVSMPMEHLLQAVSGQHKHIGQGGTYGDAKRNNMEWGEWDDEDETTPSVTNEDNE